MKRYRLYCVAILCVLVFAILMTGCRSRKNIPAQPNPTVEKPAPEPEEQQKPVAFNTASANFTFTVRGLNANGQLRMQRDSVIWISLSKIIELGRVMVTQDSVLGYISPYNQYVRMSMKDARQQYGVDFNMIQRALLGEEVNTNLVQSKTVRMFLGLQFPFAKDMNVRISLKQMSGSGTLHMERVDFNLPLTFPFRIPRSASPLDFSNF